MGPRECFPEVLISGYVTGACPMSGNVIWGRCHATAVWIDHVKYFPCYLWVVSSLQMLPDTEVLHLTFTALFLRTTAAWRMTEDLPSTSWVNQPAFPPARNIFCCRQQICDQIIIIILKSCEAAMGKSDIKFLICRAQQSGLPLCSSQAALDTFHSFFR